MSAYPQVTVTVLPSADDKALEGGVRTALSSRSSCGRSSIAVRVHSG